MNVMDARMKYKEALGAFAQPGNRWAAKGSLVYWGKAVGLSADEIIADARSVGVLDRDADIRRGWNEINPQGFVRTQSGRSVLRTEPPRKYRRHVRDLIWGDGNGTIDWVRECSPTYDWIGMPTEVQTEMFMKAICGAKDLIHVFRQDVPCPGRLGVNLMPAGEWLPRTRHGNLPGNLLVPNPFTGEEGDTSEGKRSLIAQSCLADYPYLILEMDELPLPKQYAFWRGFVLSSRLAERLVSIVYSGNRSLHGLLYVGCHTLLEWQAARNSIRELFASDDNPAFRADAQAMRPRTGTRLPGVLRGDTGVMQELVYLNPEVRKYALWHSMVPPCAISR